MSGMNKAVKPMAAGRLADAAVPNVTPPARRGRTPSADVERRLLTAAETVLVRDGPHGLTIRAVTAEAGIAPMSVYNRLGGKDGLVDALLIRGFDRLRAAIEAGREPDLLTRLLNCGLRYREFALANPHFYAIMFEGAILHEEKNPDVRQHANAAFTALVHLVKLCAAACVLTASSPVETAQQVWSAAHGAVALELKGLVLTAHPAATYRAYLNTLVNGLAFARTEQCSERLGPLRTGD